MRKGLVVGCAALVLAGCSASQEDTRETPEALREPVVETCAAVTVGRFAPVVRWHAARYPQLEAQDLYKLLYQAVAGPGHAIEDPEMARNWLKHEWAGLTVPLEGEEMFEPLTSDGRLVRVNLRPWRAEERAQETVLDAFVRTAGTVPPDTARIQTGLDAIAACSERLAEGLPFSGAAIQEYFAARAREGYPAVHHSEAYTAAYDPAYRVVMRDYLD